MSDRLGMMRAIHESPDDDLSRLAYADWLEERGELAHAEFVRAEVRLSRLDRESPEYRVLFARELELIRAHKEEWFGKWRNEWITYEVRRGFIEEVHARTASSVLACIDWLHSHHALQDLWVNAIWDEVRDVLAHPITTILARLSLVSHYGSFNSAPRRERVPLALRSLALALPANAPQSNVVADLLAAPCVGRIDWLHFALAVVSEADLHALLDGLAALPRLTHLLVSLEEDGVVRLATHPASAQLRELDLASDRFDGRALADSPYLGSLVRLRISGRVRRGDRERLQERFGSRVELPREG